MVCQEGSLYLRPLLFQCLVLWAAPVQALPDLVGLVASCVHVDSVAASWRQAGVEDGGYGHDDHVLRCVDGLIPAVDNQMVALKVQGQPCNNQGRLRRQRVLQVKHVSIPSCFMANLSHAALKAWLSNAFPEKAGSIWKERERGHVDGSWASLPDPQGTGYRQLREHSEERHTCAGF